MKKTKNLLSYEMIAEDESKRHYICPLSLIEEVSCPARVERHHKELTELTEHTHPPELTIKHGHQLKGLGVKVRKRKDSEKTDPATAAPESSISVSDDDEPPEKRFYVPPEVLEEAKKSEKSTFNCWNQKGERMQLSGYILTSIDLGPNPMTTGHSRINGASPQPNGRIKRSRKS